MLLKRRQLAKTMEKRYSLESALYWHFEPIFQNMTEEAVCIVLFKEDVDALGWDCISV